jgi:hypothetical protein
LAINKNIAKNVIKAFITELRDMFFEMCFEIISNHLFHLAEYLSL